MTASLQRPRRNTRAPWCGDPPTPAVNHNKTSIPELPVLQLGAIGNLHRRDIYDDPR